jgi:hypothetical protein
MLQESQQADQQGGAAAVAAALQHQLQQLTVMQHRQKKQATRPSNPKLQSLAAAVEAARAPAVARTAVATVQRSRSRMMLPCRS